MTAPFDGKRYRNHEETGHASLGSFVRWMVTRRPAPWQRIEAAPGPPPPARVERGIRVTFVNHATVLVQMDGLNVLTDPVWSERCSPVQWAGPQRYRPPGIRFEDLPPIDMVLLSHNHYDHLDAPTMRRLARAHGPVVYTGLGNGPLLRALGLETVHEMDWWQEAEAAGGARVTCVPAQHFSGRGLRDRDATLWCGLVLRGAAGAVYFAGDTGFGGHFQAIRERLGPPDVALLPIGAYLPQWFMQRVHVSPAEAVHAHHILEAALSVGIHFGTFQLADDGQDQPLRELARTLAAMPEGKGRFITLEHGQAHLAPGAR